MRVVAVPNIVIVHHLKCEEIGFGVTLEAARKTVSAHEALFRVLPLSRAHRK